MRQVRRKVKNMLIVFFEIKGIVHKEFILAGQTVNSTVAFYGDCVKMCEYFAPKLGDKRTGCYVPTIHHLTCPFLQGSFDQKQHDCRPPPTYLPGLAPGDFSVFPVILTQLR
jgi:hypothetical protein